MYRALLFLSIVSAAAQTAPKRVALLVGNGDYQRLPALPSVKTEVQTMQAALQDAGFNVTVAENVTQTVLATKTLPSFLNTVGPGDVCFFYYSGYAMQAQQDNYLLPVDFDPASKQSMNFIAASLTGIQQSLDEKKAGLKMIVLEASHSNPDLMAQGIGLASADVGDSTEIMFAFAARPNQAAPEPARGDIGLFTKSVAAAIRKKGLNLTAVFQDVQKEVSDKSARGQQIFFLPSFTQEFYFHAPDPVKRPEPETKTVVVMTQDQRAIGFPHVNRKDREEYVWIPSGSFMMGCVPSDLKCHPEEKPQHAVTLKHGFWMGRNEVEVSAYQRFVAEDKKKRKMPPAPDWDKKWNQADHPISEVTWEEAGDYCAWAGGRLPTEAEWEYAARGGKKDEIYPQNDPNSRDAANFAGKKGNDIFEFTSPVKKFDPNPFGLFDMAGNVWEWCKDGFSKTYYSESPAEDPQGPIDPKNHVVRGGSWNSDPNEHLRISYRKTLQRANNLGFRCVLNDGPDADKILGITK